MNTGLMMDYVEVIMKFVICRKPSYEYLFSYEILW